MNKLKNSKRGFSLFARTLIDFRTRSSSKLITLFDFMARTTQRWAIYCALATSASEADSNSFRRS